MSDQPDPSIDVAHIARLARLALTPDEGERLRADLEKILAYVAELSAVDVTGVQPTTHPLPFVRAFREDTAGPALPQSLALRGAPADDGEAFIVPKVV